MARQCRRLLPKHWQGLENDEKTICNFGHNVLQKIGFKRGVFHIEGREQHTDRSLHLIEVNPRAPGGSLWRSALLRSGYDLEMIDAAIQLGMNVPHPIYASNAGVLQDWGGP
jgi:predicted ATP-grasp superfamily ATP-dependent carboligase